MRWIVLIACVGWFGSIGWGQSTLSTGGTTETSNRAGGRPIVLSHGGSSHEKTSVGFPSLQPPSQLRNQGREGGSVDSSYQLADSVARDSSHAGASVESNSADSGLPLDSNPESSRSKMTGPLVTVCSSLAIVLALFSALVWAGRRFGGGAAVSKPLPASALSPLGHVMLDPRTKLLLVKCGRRILILSQTASGVTPISEITHPDEVRELIASCSAEARAVFEKTLREIELEPARGFTGPADDPVPRPHGGHPSGRSSGRLFATA
ncbi:FliO/MopB family protein [Neorhodopirellula pilleata]|uniref:Flagellar biosynthesis protein, FliO n=1 Tax=Neorhodopirellula pilleata TaxID=2714738 RepID=A0A5C6AW60_9BACT|nr:flagellar biosynthetic protein FliO [Neorhodopirellula pilleata]TWU03272.1 Flagellar biosynthesis protein, FliO [Neorhodopirellula pilleata]